MDDEAESSQARRHEDDEHLGRDEAREDERERIDEEEEAAEREKLVKERRVDAKRKRIVFLDHLLRELDTLVFLELITLYHLEYDCNCNLNRACMSLLIFIAAPFSGSPSAP
jgi:hypothetical protein